MNQLSSNATTSVEREPSFEEVNAAALAAYPGLLSRWFPNGHLHGHEFRIGNLQGEAGESLSVNIRTGVWRDFASDHGGSDPVSLYAAINGLGQAEAKSRVAEDLGLASGSNGADRSAQLPTKARANGPITAANGTTPAAAPPNHHPKLGEPTFWHEYTDTDGHLILYHCRFDPKGQKKQFRPLCWCEGRWKWGDPEGLLPLYGLPDLAAHPEKPVLLVEGEKTAEIAREIVPDFVITTWPHGGKSIGKVDWSPLKGRHVTCWPDADENGAGIKTMEKAAEKIIAAGTKSAAVVKLPEGLPDTWDLGDTLPDDWTIDTVKELIEAVQPVKPAAPEIISPTDWYGAVVPERKWVVDKWMPSGNVSMLSGDGGLGKSQIVLQLLINAALSRHWLGYPTLACKTLGVFCEDDEDELHRRTFWTCQDLGVELCDLQNLALINRVGLDSVMVEFDAQERGHPTPFFNQVLEQAQDFGARLVVLDSLHDIFAGNENSRPQARHFINALRRIAIAIDGAVLITAHPSLSGRSSGTGEAGSTAWHNAVRSRLYLTSPAQQDGEDVDPNRRILTNKKANYGRLGEVIECEWRKGVFVPIGQGLSKLTRDHQAEETFLECLDLLAERQTPVSEAPTSTNYAPKKMARMKESGKCSKRDLERAMERLFSAGAITNEQDGPPSRRKNMIVRVESEKP